jgi:hypothetical protein
MYKIIDNFLSNEDFNRLKNLLTGYEFPWFLQNFVAYENQPRKSHWYFSHKFYEDGRGATPFYSLIDEIFLKDKLDCAAILRVKGNLYPRDERFVEHDWHTDYNFNHSAAIFYINTNNGYTILEDGTKIESIENRMLFFDASKKHKSTNCTDTEYRININFNYMKETF